MGYKPLSIESELKKKIIRCVPPINGLIKQKDGYSYLSAENIIDILNYTFGYMWSWEVKETWMDTTAKRPSAHVLGNLTVYLKDEMGEEHAIVKSGLGGQPVVKSSAEDAFKGAASDAIKRAARNIGIGLQLWRTGEPDRQLFDYLSYEDPWTDELKEEHKEELDYVQELTAKFTPNGMNQLTAQWSGGQLQNVSLVSPDQIGAFTEWLKATVQQMEEQEQQNEAALRAFVDQYGDAVINMSVQQWSGGMAGDWKALSGANLTNFMSWLNAQQGQQPKEAQAS